MPKQETNKAQDLATPLDLKNLTVHSLRKNGFKVKIVTQRWTEYQPLKPKLVYRRSQTFDDVNRYGRLELMVPVKIASRGGVIQIDVTSPNGREYSVTVKCRKTDTFSQKIGVQIGLGKIMKQYINNA